MENSDFSALSYKSLRTLKLIYELGSLTQASIELGQNQPTVSYTLEQLRSVFNDPLFVRSGRGVAPTNRCHKIMPNVTEVLAGMSGLLQPSEFVPAQAQLDITISCNQYELYVIAPKLIQHLHSIAPNIKLTFIQSHLIGHQQLQRGQCDMLLTPVEGDYEGLYRQRLFEERYVCVVGQHNPGAEKPLLFEDYIGAKHIEVGYEGGWRPLYLSIPALQKHQLDVALKIPGISNLTAMIDATNLILTIPERLACLIKGQGVIKEPPFKCFFDINLYWNKMTHHSVAHKWLRTQIMDLFKKKSS